MNRCMSAHPALRPQWIDIRIVGQNPPPTTESGTPITIGGRRILGRPSSVVRCSLLGETSSPPVPPFSPRPVPTPQPPSPYTFKLCPTAGPGSRGLIGTIVPLLHRSQNTSTMRRRPCLLGALSARFSTVPLFTRSSFRPHFDCSVYSRGGHRAVLPMYDSAPQPCPS